ncbi:MAG: metallophosphoesterase family protein, partial [Pseudomonadota bacterium]
MNKPDDMLSQLCETVFAEAEMIFHAGDLTGLAVLNAFSGKDVVAVYGNMDRHDVACALHDREVIQAGRFR